LIFGKKAGRFLPGLTLGCNGGRSMLVQKVIHLKNGLTLINRVKKLEKILSDNNISSKDPF